MFSSPTIWHACFYFYSPTIFFNLDLHEVLNLRKEYSPKQLIRCQKNSILKCYVLNLRKFWTLHILTHIKTVSWNTNRVNLKYGICITKTSFYSYHLNVRKEKFARELHRLPTVKLNPWKVSPACLHQHKRVLVRETTPNICFVIYFAEISNYFQMYNSNSNAESKIRKKK